MKRSILRLSERTRAVTLPSSWMRKNSLSSGEFLEVEEKGDKLVISTKTNPKEITINIDKCNAQFITKAILSAYHFGYDKVKLIYSEKCLDIKKKETVNTMDIINDTCNQLIGFEIVSKTENICVIKEVTGFNGEEFKTILRRTFLLLNEFANESFHDCRENKQKDMIEMHRTIRKFVNYLKRYLNKYGKNEKTLAYNDLVTALVGISTALRVISKEKRKYSPTALRWYNDIVLLLERMYKNFYKFDEYKSSQILDKRKSILNSYNYKTIDDSVLSQRLAVILNHIYDIVECTMEIQLEGEKVKNQEVFL